MALDASAVCGGPVTRAMECAASEVERAGADVTRIRLYSLFGACCAACGTCRATASCSRRHEAIDAVSGDLAAADLLLVGVTSSISQRDPRVETLLRRLVGSFGGVYSSRRSDASLADSPQGKRAALISSSPPLLGAAAALGILPYGLGGVWRVLDSSGVRVVGCTSVASSWSGPASWDLTRERAVRLGRTLAVGCARQPERRLLPASPELLPARVTPRVA